MKRLLAALESLGNRVPDPVALFLIMGLGILLVSRLFDGTAVLHPGTGESVDVQSLLTIPGLRRIFTEAIKNFAAFPPLGTVLVAMLGIGLADRAGLFAAALRRLVGVPPRLLTLALVFAGVNASIASDAGFVVLVPLGAALFAAAGRAPLAGLAAAFAGVSAAFSANLLITGLDPLLAGLTQLAARLVDPEAEVVATDNWYFMVASVLPLTVVGAWITERWVEPRLPPATATAEQDAPPSEHEGPALRAAGLALLLAVVALLPVVRWVLSGEDGSYKPFFDSIVPLVSLLFGLAGLVYGARSGTIRDLRGAVAACSAAMGTMGGYLVLSFVAAQVVAWFSWSNLGLVLAVRGAELLKQADLPRAALLVAFILFTALLDLLIVSASAKWAILAPVFVPMLGILQISPALTQAAYRVGDSPFNVISPLFPYLPVVLTVARRYNPETGLGTLLAAMLPYALVFLPLWTAFLLFWVELGLPLGP